jgi:hypothetical protein
MAKTVVEVSIHPLTRLTEETLRELAESAEKCGDCALILKGLVDGNGLGSVVRADGRQFKEEEQKRHLLEMKGLALTPENVADLRRKAGACRQGGSGCFFCARILDALSPDRRLQQWPAGDKMEQGTLPVEAQRAHVMVEFGHRVEWEEAG